MIIREDHLNGDAAEILLRKILVDGNCLASVPARVSQILSVVRKYHRPRYDKAYAELYADGYEVEDAPKGVIVDHFLGLDAVLNLDGCLIGVDITVNPLEVDGKMRKLSRLKRTLQNFSIEGVVVIYLDVAHSVSKDDEDGIFFRLLDEAEALIDGQKWSTDIEIVL